MKLHLPKRLLTALLAAFTAISLSTGSAAWGLAITGDGNLETITLNASDAYVGAYAQYSINSNKEGVLTRVNTNQNFGTTVSLKFTLNDDAIENIPGADLQAPGIGLVWSTTANNANIGLQLYNADNDTAAEITGRWDGIRWNNGNNKASDILKDAQYELKMAMGVATSWDTTAQSGTTTTTTASGLNTSNSQFLKIYYNTNFVDSFQTQEYSNLTFSNDSGWSRSYSRTGFNNAYSSPLSVAADGFGNENDVIAGGVGGLTITATAEASVTLGNTMYLAALAEGKNTISINNAGAVELSRNLYLVENASIASTGTGNITISGAVTDKNVPTGAESNTANGAYTLSLSGTGYNFTGEVDVHGLHIAEGAKATFSNKLTIDSTITGSGNMTLGGVLKITDGMALDDVVFSYTDGATSGYRTGYSATVFEGNLSVNDNTLVELTLQDADPIGNVAWSGGIINVAITSSVYDINETLTYDATAMGKATRLYVSQNGVLDFTTYNLGTEDESGNDKALVGIMNKISGPGSVSLANGAVIQTQGERAQVQLAANYKVAGDATSSLTLTSWKSDTAGTWRTWLVTEGGSLTVGDNGEGTLKVLAGQRLSIQNGGQVQVGNLNLGYDGINSNTDNPGSLVMSGATSKLTVGGIVMQNGISVDATWLNEINITGGTLKVTGETAITYNALNVKTNVTLGGSSENESVLLQTGDISGWTMSKQSDAASTFNVGHVTIDAANTQCITFNGATITGHIKNNAQLALGADVVFGNSSTITNAGTLTLHHRENTVNLNTRLEKVTSHNTGHTIVSGTGNKTLSDDLTFGGNLTLKGGSFGTSTEGVVNSITGSSGKLVLDDVDAYIGSTENQRLNTNLELINGTALHLTHNDVFNYSSYSTSVGTDSIIALGATRQSVSNNAIVMAGGTIYGIGGIYTDKNYTAGLDFHQSGKIVATENSLIATGIASRDAEDVVTIEVASGKTLTLGSYTAGETTSTAALVGSGSFTKTGTGTLLYKGASFTNSLVLNGGVFEYYTDADVTHAGTISGSAELRKSGTGILTLNSANTSVTTLNVIAGEIIYNSTSDTTHTLRGNAGSKFTKKDSGTLTVTSDSYNGDIEVCAGTLKFDGKADSETNNSNRKITVQTGATLDINGKARHYEVVMQENATLTNTGAAIGNNQRQLHTITLNGDATVSGTGNLYLINNGYNTTFLNLNQHTLTKTGTNTFYLKNTTVQSAGVIRVEEGTVQTMSTTAGILDISKVSLEIANRGSFVLAEKSQQIQNLTLEAGGTLTINSGLTLTTMGDVTWNGGAISGNLCLNGTVSQTGGTVDLSNAVLSGTSLTQFDKVGDATLPTKSGLYAATYKLIDGSISLTSGEQSAQSTIIVGGHSYALNLNAGTFAVNSNYYVASDDSITISSESGENPISQATYFYVDGTLNIAGVAGNATTVKDILAYSGGVGKLVLMTNATLTNNVKTLFTGTLSIAEKGTLNFGYVKEGGSDMSSFSKVELDGGTLNYNNMDTTLNNLTVTENGGAMYVADYKNAYTNPILLAGSTDIQGDFVYKTEYKSYLRIEELTGKGTWTITTETGNNRVDGGAHVQIDSLSGFTGHILLDPEHNNINRVEVTAALAKSETLKASQITINDANKSSFTLTGSGTYDLGSSTSAVVSGLTDATHWTGTVRLSDVVASGMDFETYGNAASKVALNGVSGYFDRSTNNNVHIILEKKGLTFSDFSTDDNYTFVKGISGAGNFIIDAHDRTDNPVMATPTIRIGVNEDASLTWSGKFQVNDIRTDSASNPGEAFVRLYLNGNGSYFDSTAASAGVEMNDSVGTLKVFVGHATSADNAMEDTKYTPGDGLTTINGFVKNNSTGTGRLELTALNNTVFNKEVDVTSMTVNSGKTATLNSTLKAGTLKLGDTATITKAEGKDTASMQNVKLSEDGIASADETKTTKGTATDAKVTLAALAAGTSFSIEDVTLSNVNIEAANAEDRVNLSGVGESTVQLTKGEFHMLDKPQVGTGGSAINPVEGGHTGLEFSTSLLNGMTLGADASMVVDLGDLSGFTGMSSGKPTFSITLEGFRISGFDIDDYLAENPGIYFAADSWLGQLLVAQGASQYVKGDSLEAGAQATAGTGSGVSVSYKSSSVGTVIKISGLQVPEPTTSTLGLIALTALVSRRRRK